jgi:MFS family permease
MDDIDFNNARVLAIFAGSLIAFVVGYLLAWRAKRTAYRRVGSAIAAIVAAFAGLLMLVSLIGAIMPLPPPDGSPLWRPLVAFLVFSPLPLSALYFSFKFIRQALRAESAKS